MMYDERPLISSYGCTSSDGIKMEISFRIIYFWEEREKT